MDFERVLRLVGDFLDRRGADWAVIGGLALAAYGFVRVTLDLDVVVEATVQDDLIAFLEAEGWETLHRSTGYSNHQHPDGELGRVDVVYVRGATAAALFAATREVPGPGGSTMRAPKPEHLIAMKALAIKNDPERAPQDLADIHRLLQLPGVDREEARRSFVRHGLEARFDELERA